MSELVSIDTGYITDGPGNRVRVNGGGVRVDGPAYRIADDDASEQGVMVYASNGDPIGKLVEIREETT